MRRLYQLRSAEGLGNARWLTPAEFEIANEVARKWGYEWIEATAIFHVRVTALDGTDVEDMLTAKEIGLLFPALAGLDFAKLHDLRATIGPERRQVTLRRVA